MSRFLIEVPHEAEKVACAHVVKVFLDTGSHFLAKADWGCKDGVHKAWIIVDVPDKEVARSVLPPMYRQQATIVGLNYFAMEEIDAILGFHEG
jgi:hypothetical protein